jgi:CheY-like chemotaxis protein
METHKALVIDDEQIVLDSVSKILREEDYSVDITLSGREGRDTAIHPWSSSPAMPRSALQYRP